MSTNHVETEPKNNQQEEREEKPPASGNDPKASGESPLAVVEQKRQRDEKESGPGSEHRGGVDNHHHAKEKEDEDEDTKEPCPTWYPDMNKKFVLRAMAGFDPVADRLKLAMWRCTTPFSTLPWTAWLCDHDGNRVCEVSWGALQASSRVIENMSYNQVQETNAQDSKLRLHNCSRETVLAFRDFIHLGYLQTRQDQCNLAQLINALAMYDVPGCLEWIFAYMLQDDEDALKAVACLADIADAHMPGENRIRSDFMVRHQLIIRCIDCLTTCTAWATDYKFVPLIARIPWRCLCQFLHSEAVENFCSDYELNRTVFGLAKRWYNERLRLATATAAAAAAGGTGLDAAAECEKLFQKTCVLLDVLDISNMPREFLKRELAPSGLHPSWQRVHFIARVQMVRSSNDGGAYEQYDTTYEVHNLHVFEHGADLRKRLAHLLGRPAETIRMVCRGNLVCDSDYLAEHVKLPRSDTSGCPVENVYACFTNPQNFLGFSNVCVRRTEDMLHLGSMERLVEKCREGSSYAQSIMRRFQGIVPDLVRIPYFGGAMLWGLRDIGMTLLSPLDCATLVMHFENRIRCMPHRHAASAASADSTAPVISDVDIMISRADLQVMISTESYAKLNRVFEGVSDTFPQPFNRILLCRSVAPRPSVFFHTSEPLKTMVVALNDTQEYTGGIPVYATQNGIMYVSPPFVGQGAVYEWNVPRAVTMLSRGKQYTLRCMYVHEDSP